MTDNEVQDLANAYATASTAADHFRAAICAWAGIAERPADDDLIALLNWDTALRRAGAGPHAPQESPTQIELLIQNINSADPELMAALRKALRIAGGDVHLAFGR